MKVLVTNRPNDPEFKATIASLKKARAQITLISEEESAYYDERGTLTGFVPTNSEGSTSSHSEQRS
jgi:hypothetical protein